MRAIYDTIKHVLEFAETINLMALVHESWLNLQKGSRLVVNGGKSLVEIYIQNVTILRETVELSV